MARPGRGELGFAREDDESSTACCVRVPGIAVLLRLPGLPGPGRPPQLVGLLRPERIGVTLSEELQLHPEQSTDALVVHHPEAKYFNAG